MTPPEILLNDGSAHFHVLEDALPSDLLTAGGTPTTTAARLSTSIAMAPPTWAGAPGVPNRLLLNDGTGHFHDLRGALPEKPWGNDDSNGIAVTPVDVSGDGHVDLLIGYTKDEPYYVGRWIQVLINNGDGTFRDETPRRLPPTDNSGEWPYTIQGADLNGDRKPDFGVSVWWVPPDMPPIYLNDGHGMFTPLARDALVGRPAPTLVFLDANGDGRIDIYFAESGHPSSCFNVRRRRQRSGSRRDGGRARSNYGMDVADPSMSHRHRALAWDAYLWSAESISVSLLCAKLWPCVYT